MGAFAVVGLLLGMLSIGLRNGRLALISLYIFGIGVWGDGGGIGVFGAIGAAVVMAGIALTDIRVVGLGAVTFFVGASLSTMALM